VGADFDKIAGDRGVRVDQLLKEQELAVVVGAVARSSHSAPLAGGDAGRHDF
jgi:hypothetical protein